MVLVKLNLKPTGGRSIAASVTSSNNSKTYAASAPNSASSQFYITLGPAAFLDGNYAVFGRVTEGLDVVQSIRVGDVMTRVYLAGE